jgi:iron(III) transport system substrate-binding protein
MSRVRSGHRVVALAAIATLAVTGITVAQSPSTAPVASSGASPVAPSAVLPDLSGITLTVYSGRSEELVAPILADFAAATGAQVDVRYGDSAELAALLLEEGDRSPADVFFSQDAGALGAVGGAGLLAALPEGTLAAVDPAWRDGAGRWVGITGRARVAARSTERVGEDELPASVLGFTDPAWQGRLGWVPTNASFQAFVTALRVLQGEDAARAWLEGVLANDPVVFESNSSAVEGVAAGEADVALVNHYYLMRLLEEHGPEYPVANHFFTDGDPGALVNVAGAGVLASSDTPEAATALIDSLLAEPAQTYFATETFEYPLAAGVAPDPRLTPIAEIGAPDIDLSQLADLQGTVSLLQEVGALD